MLKQELKIYPFSLLYEMGKEKGQEMNPRYLCLAFLHSFHSSLINVSTQPNHRLFWVTWLSFCLQQKEETKDVNKWVWPAFLFLFHLFISTLIPLYRLFYYYYPMAWERSAEGRQLCLLERHINYKKIITAQRICTRTGRFIYWSRKWVCILMIVCSCVANWTATMPESPAAHDLPANCG